MRTLWQALAAPKPRVPANVHQLLRDARLRDPLGHQIHTVLAMIFLFTLPLSPAAAGVASALLGLNTLIRLPHTIRCYEPAVDVRCLWWLGAWAAWCALSLTWSSDPKLGFDNLGASRMLLLPLALWPILDRLPWLIGALLLGVFAQNVMQLLQLVDVIEWRAREGEGRLGGLVHPIHTGMWCLAAMCWHMMAAMRSRGWVRWCSTVGLLIAAAGLIGSGSRGPWLAAIIALPPALVITMVRRAELRRPAIVIATAGFMICAAATPLVLPKIRERIDQTILEWNDAVNDGVYWTSVGSRAGMTRWAWEIFAKHPIRGVGMGGYPAAQDQLADFQDAVARMPAKRLRTMMVHEQPHSTWMYVLSSTGIVGGALFFCGIAVALRQFWRDPPDHVYADAAFFIAIGWIIGASFDTYIINGILWGMFAALIAFTLPMRPPVRSAVDHPSLASSRDSSDAHES